MTEQNTNLGITDNITNTSVNTSLNTENNVQIDNNVSQETLNTSIKNAQNTSDEKMLKQSDVNEIVGAVRKEAAERARKEALAELQKTQNNSSNEENISEDRIRKIIAEEQERAANLAIAKKVATEFTQKLVAGKSKYQDFEETVSQLNLPNVPELVHWTNSLDNTADVIYDIAKNPSKFANILMLQQTAPHLAQIELQKLSESIKKNHNAQNQVHPKQPLSQINPSIADMNNGEMSLSDLKKAPWLRG